jgi:hypothetical protein
MSEIQLANTDLYFMTLTTKSPQADLLQRLTIPVPNALATLWRCHVHQHVADPSQVLMVSLHVVFS